MQQDLRIWCTARFTGEAAELLRDGTAEHRLAVEGEETPFCLADADVALGQPDPDAVMAAPELQWVHVTSAGYTRYDRDDVRQALRAHGARLTTSSHVYDEPCAQHALAMMLALARQLPQSLDAQRGDHSWSGGERRARSYLLSGQSVLLLGFGAIGERLAELLAPFGMDIVALRRNRRGGEPLRIIDEAGLAAALAEADHVVNLLPENDETRGFVNAVRLAAMKPGACFYNVGRGVTVDQDALLQALHSGRLGAAYLDVTDPEPLPPEHPLWTTPNCYLTPHSAGGHRGETVRLVRHFLANLTAFEAGTELVDRVI